MIYYKPAEHELEAASNSYLMSLLAVMAGLPFPIINLLATACALALHTGIGISASFILY